MNLDEQKTQIFEQALKDIPFDGWSIEVFEKAATDLGFEKEIIPALFPKGNADILDFFATWTDEKMMESLSSVTIEDLKVRARIRIAVEKRIEILTPYKEVVQHSLKKLRTPNHARLSTSIMWRTSDFIWNWAGDEATDYNKYTKRGLLSGVIGSTFIYWLNDDSDDAEKTKKFLNNRIENVLFVGKNIGKVVKPLESIFKNFIVPNIKSKTEKA
jgi:ubiquinone biosynthesis protein COQ9